jgi:hypothetical protein
MPTRYRNALETAEIFSREIQVGRRERNVIPGLASFAATAR